ncbi:tRNA pseudouridine synthase A, partial [Dictyocoela roeselum]
EELIKIILSYKKRSKINITKKQKILLKFNYEGQHFSGLVEQNNVPTISDSIIRALYTGGLIDTPNSDDIEFAGRTDSGVSGINMVCAVQLLFVSQSFPYDWYINCYLPHSIRITAWAVVDENFSPRFSCIQRSYKYFFRDKNLDMIKVGYGIIFLKNLRDFRKFSKLDKTKPDAYYFRKLDEIFVENFANYSVLVVKCRGFTRNMVRRIFSFLKLIGEGIISIEKLFAYPDILVGNNIKANLKPYNSTNVSSDSTNFSEGIPMNEVTGEEVFCTPIDVNLFSDKTKNSSHDNLHTENDLVFSKIPINRTYFESIVIGKADPEFLLFYGAKFDQKIEWNVSERNLRKIKSEFDNRFLFFKMKEEFFSQNRDNFENNG